MGLTEVETRIAAAATAAGRQAVDVVLIAVSKVQPMGRVVRVLESGHRVFGENRVQEAQGKWPGLRETFGRVSVHLLGPLQTNKARSAMALFDAIHSVDRPKLARTLARLRDEGVACPDVFVQVNTGAEPQKAGVLPDDVAAMVAECRALELPLRGLMCIPPADTPAGPHFEMLAQMAKAEALTGLSMGMSGDFEEAIAHGATHVRVGSAVFGERTPV